MSRKSLALVGLLVILGLLAGCRKSAVAPIEELTPEEEATAVIGEAQENTDLSSQAESAVATPTVPPEEEIGEPTAEPTVEPTAVPVVEATVAPTSEAWLEATAVPTTETWLEATAVPVATEAAGATTGGSTYTVRAGDNLYRIALSYNLSVQALALANNITNPGLIYVGQTLTIPAGGTTPTQPVTPSGCSTVHVVQQGDNLFRIALRYGYNQYYLAQFNGISNPSLVYLGQAICIP